MDHTYLCYQLPDGRDVFLVKCDSCDNAAQVILGRKMLCKDCVGKSKKKLDLAEEFDQVDSLAKR